jgi:hypothetical protein
MPINEELAIAIVQPNATYADALAFMDAHRANAWEERGVELGDGRDYCNMREFWSFEEARKVWATDAPPRHALPHLGILLQPYVMGNWQQDQFMAMLTNAWQGYSVWLASQKRDPANPHESKEQRAKRLAAERVARHRLRNGTGAETEEGRRATALKDAYTAYQNACAARKAAHAAVDAHHDPLIKAAHDNWKALKESEM